MFTTIRAGMALWATRTMMRASYAPLLVGSRTKKHQPLATASFGLLRTFAVSACDCLAHLVCWTREDASRVFACGPCLEGDGSIRALLRTAARPPTSRPTRRKAP